MVDVNDSSGFCYTRDLRDHATIDDHGERSHVTARRSPALDILEKGILMSHTFTSTMFGRRTRLGHGGVNVNFLSRVDNHKVNNDLDHQ